VNLPVQGPVSRPAVRKNHMHVRGAVLHRGAISDPG
jgi:hypothetical protein